MDARFDMAQRTPSTCLAGEPLDSGAGELACVKSIEAGP